MNDQMIHETVQNDDLEALASLAVLCRQRANTYAFIARLYRTEVDSPFLEQLKAMRFPANTGNAKVDEGYRLMARFICSLWDDGLIELARDYVRAFIGHGLDSFSASYPYESVYTSEERLLMQEARDEVVAIYRSVGLDKRDGWTDGEDHVALELEFMQVLAERAADALEAGREDEAASLLSLQGSFLEEHLASWVPMMTADMRRFVKTDLYRGLAELTDGFLEADGEFLAEVLLDDEQAEEGEGARGARE